MDYGMTDQGFVPKRLAEIQSDLNLSLAEITHPETGEQPFINATDDSILQQLVGVFSEALADCWNAAYAGAVQFDPLKNFGAGQSGTVQLNAMLRKAGAATVIEMQLGGTAGTRIPSGSLVATQDNQYTYALIDSVVLDSAGHGSMQARETAFSGISPELGTVVRIMSILPGGEWTTAKNTALVSEGRVEETDEELRVRQQRSTSLTSYRIIEAIYAAVIALPGVLYCRAYQNPRTYPADDRGIPFKEVAVIVEGGADKDIAEALFLRFPTGQIGYGDITEILYDAQGYPNPISFSRPKDLDIWVAIKITITDRSSFPDNAPELIAENIIEFAKYGGAGSANGFPPGSAIIRSRLYTPINNVAGHSVTSLLIGTSAVVAADDIAMLWNQVGRFDTSRIQITIE